MDDKFFSFDSILLFRIKLHFFLDYSFGYYLDLVLDPERFMNFE